ncbi:TetR/AcrR family transcriptional regulator [Pantoea sp. 18069]|uniref:TetR/AcrR family transcriptional regulator n=1 Tax=Pantoea sp. 18069 TaxID=2681415 RepID=UPI00135832CA|nr:TetR/AcrR family transcriptional regulator [Pantoea sp. 18069]
MESPPPPPARGRGRPPSITHTRIADAGIALGLRNITFVGLASALGVSHMALYKHVASLEALKQLVADEIIRRWHIPQALGNQPEGLRQYLTVFSASIQEFVKAHPGVTPYMLRRMAASEAVIEKIQSHQRHIAQAYGIPQERAQWLLATVAFHCFAAADTVYSVAAQEPLVDADRAQEEAEMEVEFTRGMQALIIGALQIALADAAGDQPDTRPN